jgi:serine/threonine-protein kinase
MANDDITAFVGALRQSRLFSPAQLDEVDRDLGSRFNDSQALAWHLLDRGWLTTFQINQLVQGHGEDLRLGHYILLERLGQGAMGRVYKARCAETGLLVALKVLKPDLFANVQAMRQFENEIRVLSQLDHLNIVRTIEAGHEGERCYFSMEYVEGMHLGKVVQHVGPLPVWLACDFACQAALGLQHAHEACVIHRDIKPANLLMVMPRERADRLCADGADALNSLRHAILKILDWGLAGLKHPAFPKESSDDSSIHRDQVGTADYIAPEQALDPDAADIRSDLYSLGCTLYHLLTGQPPFPGGSLMQKLLKHQQAEPTPPSKLRSDLPPRLEAILQKLMAKDPADRYQTPAALLATLSTYRTPPTSSGGAPSARRSRPTANSTSTEPSAATSRERRAYVRFQCQLDSSCRSLGAGTNLHWDARVLDISKGGVALVLNRRFEPGTLLEVDLHTTTPGALHNAMVRVMNVRRQGDGSWVLGCAFSHELDEQELWVFRAERVRPPSPDSRAWIRFPCVADHQVRAVAVTQDRWPAKMLNISAGGVALQVQRHVEVGTHLRLELQGDPDLPPLLVLAHVVHATALSGGDWILGCAFSHELTDDELDMLL